MLFSGETIWVIGYNHFLVESHTYEDEFYAVSYDDGLVTCTCRSSDCLKDCRHARAIRLLMETINGGCLPQAKEDSSRL